jgi:Amt family ammonium transporter
MGVGMIDFAGSGVVHVTGGATALIATILLGPRKGRFHNDRGEKLRRAKIFVGHSKSLQVCFLYYVLKHILALCN